MWIIDMNFRERKKSAKTIKATTTYRSWIATGRHFVRVNVVPVGVAGSGVHLRRTAHLARDHLNRYDVTH
jgi:hypothetical protein